MSTADVFAPLDGWLRGAILALEPNQRKAMLRDIARDLRRRNQKRITAQTGPDGERWAPRKRDKQGRVKSQKKMMIGLRAARRMAIKNGSNGASLGFSGRLARIAQVHQKGLADDVVPGGVTVKYPARTLLGFAAADREAIRDKVFAAFADLPTT